MAAILIESLRKEYKGAESIALGDRGFYTPVAYKLKNNQNFELTIQVNDPLLFGNGSASGIRTYLYQDRNCLSRMA